jgi:hypothetical protein
MSWASAIRHAAPPFARTWNALAQKSDASPPRAERSLAGSTLYLHGSLQWG